jgi:hypothetical protein
MWSLVWMATSLEGKQLLATTTWIDVYFNLGNGLESIVPNNNSGGQKVWM